MSNEFWDRLSPFRRRRPKPPPTPSPVPIPTPSPSTGFILPCEDISVRPSLPSNLNIPSVPGPFRIPEPYDTQAILVARGCRPVGMSYWKNINNHVTSTFMWIHASFPGRGIVIFAVDKETGKVLETEYQLPLADHTGEGVYWSASNQTLIYYFVGSQLRRHNVRDGSSEIVADLNSNDLTCGCQMWQCHSSVDDNTHSGTVMKDGARYGVFVYKESTRVLTFFRIYELDECQIDKGGNYLLVKDGVGPDNWIFDVNAESKSWRIANQDGAVGHSDNGYGYTIGEDDFNQKPGAAVYWSLNRDGHIKRKLLYHTTDWKSGMGHISHAHNGSAGHVWLSNLSIHDTPRANEILTFPIIPSQELTCRVVAPNLVGLAKIPNYPSDPDRSRVERYNHTPKGNCDVTGQWFCWTANAGRDDLSMFLVRL